MDSIFVSIASFLDYEVRYTILDCINKADNPANLTFSICLQYNEEELTSDSIIDDLTQTYSIKIDKYHYTESQGGCWARQIAQQNYSNEKYSLQVDSHTRFIQGWDTIIKGDFNKLKDEGIKKPLLTFLPPPYMRVDKAGIDYDFKHLHNLDKLNVPKFRIMTQDYWVEYMGYGDEINTGFELTPMKILYGGFVFTLGKWVKEIEQDPEHYYTGEEFALTIRSFTHGYDLFTPSQIVAWHRAHTKALPKHFTINTQEVASEKHSFAIRRLKKLIEGEDLGKYGLGNIRTLEDYENYAKVNFKERKILE